MYKIRHVVDDPNRYTGTCIGVKGRLWYVNEWRFDLPGPANIQGMVWDNDALDLKQAITKVCDEDLEWLPKLRPGYYNTKTKPWKCVWVEQSGQRQYKVGLNQRTLRMLTRSQLRRDDGRRPLRKGELDLGTLSAIYEGRTEYQPLERALSMIRRRRIETSQCALTANLAVEKGPLDATYLVHRASRLVGLVHQGKLLVDSTYQHSDLNLLEYKHEETEKLIALLTDAA